MGMTPVASFKLGKEKINFLLIPSVLVGYWLRVLYLPDPRSFKFFVGLALAITCFRIRNEPSLSTFTFQKRRTIYRRQIWFCSTGS